MRLDLPPRVSIGTEEGDTLTTFGRVVGAIRTAQGDIVVADAYSRELRFFDSTGTARTSVGGRGRGPGEFEGLTGLYPCPSDSVYAYDFEFARMSVFDTHGQFVRSFRLQGPTPDRPPNSVVSCTTSGSLVVVGRGELPRDVDVGPYETDVPVALAGRDGVLHQRIGTFRGAERYRFDSSDGPRPLGRQLLHAAGGHYVFVGESDSAVVAVWDEAGQHVGTVRWSEEPEPLTSGDIDAYIAARIPRNGDPGFRSRLESNWRKVEFPETYPVYAQLLADADGRLWVQDYPSVGAATVTWRAFLPDGTAFGQLVVPAELDVLQFGDGWLLARAVDALGVARVRLYGFTPPT